MPTRKYIARAVRLLKIGDAGENANGLQEEVVVVQEEVVVVQEEAQEEVQEKDTRKPGRGTWNIGPPDSNFEF